MAVGIGVHCVPASMLDRDPPRSSSDSTPTGGNQAPSNAQSTIGARLASQRPALASGVAPRAPGATLVAARCDLRGRVDAAGRRVRLQAVAGHPGTVEFDAVAGSRTTECNQSVVRAPSFTSLSYAKV